MQIIEFVLHFLGRAVKAVKQLQKLAGGKTRLVGKSQHEDYIPLHAVLAAREGKRCNFMLYDNPNLGAEIADSEDKPKIGPFRLLSAGGQAHQGQNGSGKALV